MTTPAAPAVESGERHGEYRRQRHSCGRATTRDSVPRRRRLPESSGTTKLPFAPHHTTSHRDTRVRGRDGVERGGVNEKAADPLGSDRGTDRASGIDRIGPCPTRSLLQRLQTNTAGWFNNEGTIFRVPDFYSNGGYPDDIDSASGDYHARLGITPAPSLCSSGGGPQPVLQPLRTRIRAVSGSAFPLGGYTTRVDVYLDVAWAATHFDRRFDWSSAINNTSGAHRRDFVFNAGTEATGFIISASNNGNRCNSFPSNLGRTPIHIITSGWYTFEHTFTGLPGTPLVVNPAGHPKATNAHHEHLGPQRRHRHPRCHPWRIRNGWFVQKRSSSRSITAKGQAWLVHRVVRSDQRWRLDHRGQHGQRQFRRQRQGFGVRRDLGPAAISGSRAHHAADLQGNDGPDCHL